MQQPRDKQFTNSHYTQLPFYPNIADDESPSSSDNSLRLRTIDVHYRVWKRDEVTSEAMKFCLLVHGFCGSTYCWEKSVDAILQLHDVVVAVDLPGFGYSDRSESLVHSDVNRGYWCFEVIKLMESTFGYDQTIHYWTLIGHSMGARCVTAVTYVWNKSARQETRIENVVIVDGACNEAQPSVAMQKYMSMILPGRVIEAFAGWVMFKESFIRKLLKNAYGIDPDDNDVHGYLNALLVPGTAKSIVDMTRAVELKQGTSVIDMNRIIPRVSLIWGDSDTVISLDYGKKLFDLLKQDELDNVDKYSTEHEGVQLHIVPNCGHCPMETHVHEFSALISSMIQFSIGDKIPQE